MPIRTRCMHLLLPLMRKCLLLQFQQDPTAFMTEHGGAGADGEDRLSALPDELLVLILLNLRTAKAARTSVLSCRWRRVWTFLPELQLTFPCTPDGIAAALDAHKVDLQSLFVVTPDAAPGSMAPWLSAAARRVSGSLAFCNMPRDRDDDDTNAAEEEEEEEEGEEEEEAAAFELPCFDRATLLYLNLGHLGVSFPPAGKFARLTHILLDHVRFTAGACSLGAAVSSLRCPCLEKLTVHNADGVVDLAIDSGSLKELQITKVRGLWWLAVAAPALRDLTLAYSFFLHHQNPPVANISTCHQLQSLEWNDSYDLSTVQLGTMEHLQRLGASMYNVFGEEGAVAQHIINRSCLGLLRRFRAVQSLCLTLLSPRDIVGYQYLMEQMTVFPVIKNLYLIVFANGHGFGPSSFHVLRKCTGIRKLLLQLLAPVESEAETACTSGRICDQPSNWRTEELLLNNLEEVRIRELRGSEHEISFVKRLLNWAKVLKRMIITFDKCVPESMAKECCQLFRIYVLSVRNMLYVLHVP
ncbi:unnamed protein product [Urochloa decumbens]|uniref:F-box domain-containing protein n=1 Tax=Urochloa decumbens TaxID=240449 RepID=A0ABC9GTY6_9POAL